WACEGGVGAGAQLLAGIGPAELGAARAFYSHSAEGYASQVEQNAAALRYQERQTTNEIRQAEANLAAAEAQRSEAAATLEDARLTFQRLDTLTREGASAEQERDHARANYDASQARVNALDRQVEAQRAALALARDNAEQIAMKRSALVASRQQRDAAEAQKAKADVRLGYTEVRAPLAGVVDVRAARPG